MNNISIFIIMCAARFLGCNCIWMVSKSKGKSEGKYKGKSKSKVKWPHGRWYRLYLSSAAESALDGSCHGKAQRKILLIHSIQFKCKISDWGKLVDLGTRPQRDLLIKVGTCPQSDWLMWLIKRDRKRERYR